jgi:hypothetical protein
MTRKLDDRSFMGGRGRPRRCMAAVPSTAEEWASVRIVDAVTILCRTLN